MAPSSLGGEVILAVTVFAGVSAKLVARGLSSANEEIGIEVSS